MPPESEPQGSPTTTCGRGRCRPFRPPKETTVPQTPSSSALAPTTPAGDAEVPETTVLIIDDHRSFADLLTVALSSVPTIRCLGSASSAAEGIRRVRQLSPSVVVMDIEMPGTDGLAATRRLRQASPGTAVAVVTAHH